MKNIQKNFCLVVVLCAAQADAMFTTLPQVLIRQQLAQNQEMLPRKQLKNWVTCWQEATNDSSDDPLNSELLPHIESLFCKHPSLSFADADITAEQTRSGYFKSLLESACVFNCPLLAQKLIELGVDVNHPAFTTPLERTISQGNTHLTSILLKKGALQKITVWGNASICTAACNGDNETLRMLLLNLVEQNIYQPLIITPRVSWQNPLNIDEHIMNIPGKKTNHLLKCATTQPHKLAKLGYPVELLPAQLPHILMMRERGVRYSGDRVGQIKRQRGRMETQELENGIKKLS